MGRVALLLVACVLVLVMPMANSSTQEIDQWLSHAKEKVTHLHFYFHDTFSGANPTAMKIAQSAITDKSPTLFGIVVMIDDPLTEGPEPTSKEVGRAQGLYGSSDQKNVGLLMGMNLVFTTGKFNGSTLAILGRNPALEHVREIPIIGGTGAFRLSRGFASLKTYFFNATSGDAIVEYNVVVSHY
ncbi:dirigent protein 21-like [Mercurialis annua]|uniref:dirigent protein 21-like n=1 Tax=Mercurialis annua TaxID=3986 RepID=UPI00215EF67F|nr:dirigent protein 21-like [Mercurialis annua]